MNVDLGESSLTPAMNITEDFDCLGQMKATARTFLSAGNVVQVYKEDESDADKLQHILNLEALKTKDNTDLSIKKMVFTDQETKALLLSEKKDDKVYLMDLAKGKIVNEFQHKNKMNIEDISTNNKLDFSSPDATFLSCQRNNIIRMDPRANNAVVGDREYKTDVGFNTIHGTKGDYFAVGSESGEVRLFNKVGGNAKNLLPSLFG